MKLLGSISIDAPQESVFDLVADPDRRGEWAKGMIEMRYTSEFDPQNPVGAEFMQRIKEGGRETEYSGVVTAYDRPNLLVSKITGGGFTMDLEYRLASSGGGVIVENSVALVSESRVAKVMGVLFGWLTRQIARKQLKRLKAIAESEAESPAG
ncbi:MAG: SRPBCC family protein [Chloroflexi bacterium]|nr:SRPBCC family protein [Chloroflexota bacterium]